MAKRVRVFTYEPVGFDLLDPRGVARGTRVVKTQPYGCPKNGTMGHCYVMGADTGEFYGLVLEASLKQTAELVEKPLTGAERARAKRDARMAARYGGGR
jgi:hypothetical protein